MDAKELDRLEAMEKAATNPPWHNRGADDREVLEVRYSGAGAMTASDANGNLSHDGVMKESTVIRDHQVRMANVRVVVAARNALPELLKLAREALAMRPLTIEEAEAELAAIDDADCEPMTEAEIERTIQFCKDAQTKRLASELKAAREVLAKLPHSADGIALVAGDIAYHPSGGYIIIPGVRGDGPVDLFDGRDASMVGGWHTLPSRCYASREAALSTGDGVRP